MGRLLKHPKKNDVCETKQKNEKYGLKRKPNTAV